MLAIGNQTFENGKIYHLALTFPGITYSIAKDFNPWFHAVMQQKI
jgi:hypothetical protein